MFSSLWLPFDLSRVAHCLRESAWRNALSTELGLALKPNLPLKLALVVGGVAKW